jgi:F420H(2)-dependent quinone reductase
MTKTRTRASSNRTFRLLNPIMRLLLRLPTGRERGLLLLTCVGRRTGRTRTVPVAYAARADGTLLVAGGGSWKWNLVDGAPVSITRGGRTVAALGELVRDREVIERLLPELINGSDRRVGEFVDVPLDAAGHPDAGALQAALDDGFALVLLHPHGKAGGSRVPSSTPHSPGRG